MHHSKLVAHLNHRWRTGGPSANLNSAGVIVHIPDGLGLRREGFVGNASRHGLPPPSAAEGSTCLDFRGRERVGQPLRRPRRLIAPSA